MSAPPGGSDLRHGHPPWDQQVCDECGGDDHEYKECPQPRDKMFRPCRKCGHKEKKLSDCPFNPLGGDSPTVQDAHYFTPKAREAFLNKHKSKTAGKSAPQATNSIPIRSSNATSKTASTSVNPSIPLPQEATRYQPRDLPPSTIPSESELAPAEPERILSERQIEREKLQERIEESVDHKKNFAGKLSFGVPPPKELIQQGMPQYVLANFLEVGMKTEGLYQYRIKLGEVNQREPRKKEVKKVLIKSLMELWGPSFRWVSDYDSVVITTAPMFSDQSGIPRQQWIVHHPRTGINDIELDVQTTVKFEKEVLVQDLIGYLTDSNPKSQIQPNIGELLKVFNIISWRNIYLENSIGKVGKKFYPYFAATELNGSPPRRDGSRFWLFRDVLEARLGFFTSMRPGEGKLLLNVNTTTSAFFAQARLSDWLINQVDTPVGMQGEELKGLRVKVDNQHAVRIIYAYKDSADSGVTRSMNARAKEREVKGLEPIQSGSPNSCYINLGNENFEDWYPAEILTLEPFQPYRKKVTSDQMVKAAERRSHQNKTRIRRQAMKDLGISDDGGDTQKWAADGILSNLGISSISEKFLKCKAKFLAPPVLHYGNGNRQGNIHRVTLSGKSSWYLRDNIQFKHPGAPLRKIYAIHLSNKQYLQKKDPEGWPGYGGLTQLPPELRRYGLNVASNEVVYKLAPASYQSNGGLITLQVRREIINALGNAMDQLRKTAEENGDSKIPLIIITFEGKKNIHIYPIVKFWADCVEGIPTCVLLTSKLFKKDATKDANVALKINFKLGGLGHDLSVSPNFFAKFQGTMIVGADVTHPGHESTAPSLAGVVATITPNISEAGVYLASARLQRSRMEYIQDLSGMIEERVKVWFEKNGTLPNNILFYRDGVSESQFEMVKALEYSQIRKGFNDAVHKLKLRLKEMPQYRQKAPTVKITLLVVTKRHHTKFFPQQDDDVAQGGRNCPFGLVVDSGVVDPHYFSFYLQSHHSPLGTAKNTHYFVVQNEMGLSDFELQAFTNYLCFTSCRALMSLSVCAPALYADSLCSRLRCYMKPGLDKGQWTSPNKENTDDRVDDYRKPELWPASGGRLNPWKKELDDIMFYM